MPPLPPERLLAHLWRATTRQADVQLYAILDAARDARIYRTLVDSEMDYVCLYRGALPQDVREAAPYLIHLHPDTPFVHWLVRTGWGNSWGIFLESAASLRELQRHFRRLLMVYDEDGKPLYFRYYDPRVLRVYLPTCSKRELEMIFGPVLCYRLEEPAGGHLLAYSCPTRSLQRQVAMLIISKAQIDTFRQLGKQRQACDLAQRLLDDAGYRVGPRTKPALVAEIAPLLTAWESIGITAAHHWLSLLECKHLFALDFDATESRQMLLNTALSADERVEWLSEQALRHQQET